MRTGIYKPMGKKQLRQLKEKNDFFRKVGEMLEPAREDTLAGFDDGAKTTQILKKANGFLMKFSHRQDPVTIAIGGFFKNWKKGHFGVHPKRAKYA